MHAYQVTRGERVTAFEICISNSKAVVHTRILTSSPAQSQLSAADDEYLPQ